MEPDHTDTTDGSLTTLDGRFLSRQRIRAAGERVTRLLVSDSTDPDDDPIAVLAGDADRGELLGLRTGHQYRFTDVRWCVPPACLDRAARPDGATGDSDDATGDCPTCGGTLRVAGTYDDLPAPVGAAAERLALTEPFVVLTDSTTVRAANADLVDDWRHEREHAPPATRTEFVCLDCDRRVHPRELRADPNAPSGDSHGAVGVEAHHDGVFLEQMAPQASPAAASRSAETLGLTTGGANDASNFRENVMNGYTPQPDALTTTGLFGDYHFPTDGVHGGATDTLFAPTYATAVSDDPVGGERERYLAVGLDSTLSVADFERPRLDLVVVLDVSGSMDARFDRYYYDERGRRRDVADHDVADHDAADHDRATKLDAATASLCELSEQLRPDDRFAVVLFNDSARVAKPLRDVASTDVAAIRRHVRDVRAGGGTNVVAGFDAARDLLARSASSTREAVERRVVFLTDAMPNAGETGTSDLVDRFEDATERGIHTTFVGVGLDANADLVDELSKIRGANHVFVHSAAAFERRLGDEFDYLVTPLVYDLSLDVVADGYEIADVHGSPNADAATGEVMHTATLFPTPKRDGETRGGIVLVELERTGDDPALALDASWTERDGTAGNARVTIRFPDGDVARHYGHDGVRKAVALTRYARVLRDWARTVRNDPEHGSGYGSEDGRGRDGGVDDWRGSGPRTPPRSEHERGSVPLRVPRAFVDDLVALRASLATELDALGDETLTQELDVLDALLDAADVDQSTVEQEGGQ